VLSKRSVFSTAISGCGYLQRLMLIIFAAGQHGPGDASQFIGDCDHYFVTWCPLGKPVHPLPETSGVILDAKQYGPSTVDQHATQIDVAALADAEQLLLASGGVLAGHDANPGCEVPPTAKGSPVADCGHRCSGDQRTKAGNLAQTPAKRVLFANAFDLVRDRLDVSLKPPQRGLVRSAVQTPEL
jgi:hypothetical protein